MIEEALLKSNYVGKDGFNWWIGQVAHQKSWKSESLITKELANLSDSSAWGFRCKIRIIGHHTFDGGTLPDEDLPWAHILIDPIFGSIQGGIGKTVDLKGGETCFGFFLDGDDGQQPVIIGLLYRSSGVNNIIEESIIEKEKSSRFRPFTGHPGNQVPSTQRDVRSSKKLGDISTPPISQSSPNNSPVATASSSFSYDIDKGILGGSNYKFPGNAFSLTADSVSTIYKKACEITYEKPTGCDNNLLGSISKILQDFISITNGLDSYLSTYVDPVLNEIVNIKESILQCSRSILGVVKLIVNKLRDIILKALMWAFKELVGLIVPIPQQTLILNILKQTLDKIFCILERIPGDLLGTMQNLLSDLVAPINAPFCALEQWTAGVLSQVMSSIEDGLSTIMSGIDWLVGGIGTVSSMLKQASSFASQIYSIIDCTGVACKTPHTWALKFGPSQKEADDWKKTVSNINVFNGVSASINAGASNINSGISNFTDSMTQTPLYAAINGVANIAYDGCSHLVMNQSNNQNELIPLPPGVVHKFPVPPIVRIVGNGMGANAIPIVGDDGSIVAVEVTSGGLDYVEEPTAHIVDNSGYGGGALVKVIVKDGAITSIYVTEGGSGYAKDNYTNIGIGTSSEVKSTGDVILCVDNIIITQPGYGYTSGDIITDGVNTYIPIISPDNGAIISIKPITNSICGFKSPPTLTINTTTGIAAKVIPVMKYSPTYTKINQNIINQQAAKTGITTIVDCI